MYDLMGFQCAILYVIAGLGGRDESLIARQRTYAVLGSPDCSYFDSTQTMISTDYGTRVAQNESRLS